MFKIKALYGGTFNPIHRGHIIAAYSLLNELALENICYIPNAIPPHREKNQVSSHHRLEMIKLAIAKKQHLSVSDYEIIQAEEQSQTSYTYLTLEYFHERLQSNESLAFIMGMDSYLNFTQWKNWQYILKMSNIIVLNRLTDKLDTTNDDKLLKYHANKLTLQNNKAGGIYFANNPVVNISSTQIRQALKTPEKSKNELHQWLDDDVFQYILQHNLYTNT